MDNRDQNVKSKFFSFFTLSTVFHIALALGIAHLTYKASQKLPKVTEVEFMAPAEASAEAGLADVQAAPAETPVAETTTPVAVEATTANEPVVAAKTETKAEAKPVTQLPAKPAMKAPVIKAQAAVVKAQAPVVEQVEETPEPTPVAQTDATPAEEQPEQTEPKIQMVAATPVDAQAEETPEPPQVPADDDVAQMADKYSADADEQFKQAEKDLAESQMAEARSLEEQAAKDRADADAAKLAAASQAAAPQSSGGETAQTAQAGDGNEPVRALAELKQVPGNRKPTYDLADRKAARSGEVIFTAYVNKSGTLSDFKLVKSSGHRSLDAKTLSALKSWKFYPNQEGRTELGFKWDLKGDAIEMPSTLRR